ncbi:hypothetical protein HUU53_03025 [Candidatus Micrarchaeota archaeon]|nr:hypothetical protein [Candidatus Micrarchaeota archaeon]
MKGQSAIEFLAILTLLAAFIVFVLILGFKEVELDFAISSAQLSGQEFADEHSYTLAGIESSILNEYLDFSGATVKLDKPVACLYPVFLDHNGKGNLNPLNSDYKLMKKDVAKGVAKTLLSQNNVVLYNQFLENVESPRLDPCLGVTGISYDYFVCDYENDADCYCSPSFDKPSCNT